MKTSFAKTFEDLSAGRSPREERFDRETKCEVEVDGQPIDSENIYVLHSVIEIKRDRPAVTNILVNPEHKARYDEILVDLDKLKTKLVNSLQKKSKLKKDDIETSITQDWDNSNFADCVRLAKESADTEDYTQFVYAVIFEPKALEILKSPEFLSNAQQFNQRYQELFDKVGTIYRKGVFNPTKAEASFSTLDKQGFFKSGHRVHLSGEQESLDQESLNSKIEQIHEEIDADQVLKDIRKKLSKNAQTQALTDLFESLSPSLTEVFLEKTKPQNQNQLRKELWAFYIRDNADADSYLESYNASKEEMAAIEQTAAQFVPQWAKAIDLFNSRFIDMPFRLAVENQTAVVLGKEQARLQFIFEDGEDRVVWSRSELRTLSQGESRALYLLYFIFDVEERILNQQRTLFVIDDAADSFDYKNKHAIIQCLKDLSKHDFFAQVILTHNFDFFRSIQNSYVAYNRCLMANKCSDSIELVQADGIKNIFVKKWKEEIPDDERILCASVPFVRNLIEYTRGDGDSDYLKLTSLLHWKSDTDAIKVVDFLDIYNRFFGTSHSSSRGDAVFIDLLFQNADDIKNRETNTGLCLEDKVLMSIAVRLKAEIYLIAKLRSLRGEPNYWCLSDNQFGQLMKELQTADPNTPELQTLDKVSVTVSSNIHLNSFMYEPILDLTIDHLTNLYHEVCNL
ncbi:hypothetical protein [Thalassobacterium sedimentorum]|nr:hypothetical protein [Coraliomargarita sp. SDUM461004]